VSGGVAVKTLRKATQPLHDAAEQRLFAAKIMAGELSLTEYARTLRSHHRVWASVEAWLDESFGNAAVTADRDLCRRMRSALAEDLASVAFEAADALPPDLPAAVDSPTLLGVFYVLRGSMLGGTVISRRLNESPGLATLPAYHFYAACATEGPKTWPAFLRRLEKGVVGERETERAVAAARTVFEMYLID